MVTVPDCGKSSCYFLQKISELLKFVVWGYESVLMQIFRTLYFCKGKIVFLGIKIIFVISQLPSLSLSFSPAPLFSPILLLLNVLANYDLLRKYSLCRVWPPKLWETSAASPIPRIGKSRVSLKSANLSVHVGQATISDGNPVICGHLCPQSMQSQETWLMFSFFALDLEGCIKSELHTQRWWGISGELETLAVVYQTFLAKTIFAICFLIAWPFVF